MISDEHSLPVSPAAASQGNGLHDHQVGRDQQIREVTPPKLSGRMQGSRVVLILGLEQSVKVAGVYEDHLP